MWRQGKALRAPNNVPMSMPSPSSPSTTPLRSTAVAPSEQGRMQPLVCPEGSAPLRWQNAHVRTKESEHIEGIRFALVGQHEAAPPLAAASSSTRGFVETAITATIGAKNDVVPVFRKPRASLCRSATVDRAQRGDRSKWLAQRGTSRAVDIGSGGTSTRRKA